MRSNYFGDSYDIVKLSLLRWLSAMGSWSVHPMLSEKTSPELIQAYTRLLGVPILSRDVLRSRMHESERDDYFRGARECRTHLLLDPSTGLRIHRQGAKHPQLYVFGHELVQIAMSRQDRLTLVFDQSLVRAKLAERKKEVLAKLEALGADEICGAAYVSHACFIIVAPEPGLVKKAVVAIRKQSELPSCRFVEHLGRRHGPLRRT